MHVIENELLTVTVNPKGAELTRIYNKQQEIDYLWSGDPLYWGKHSPVLFPIVGSLKQDTYYFDNKAYALPRHGFAREKDFTLKESAADTVLFALTHDEQSLAVYPFLFELTIRYTLRGHTLTVEYKVINKGRGLMYFSLGAHPAFKTPLVAGTVYSDYYLEFEQPESLPRWPISEDGLIRAAPEPFLSGEKKIPLSKQLFERDALVFKHPASGSLSLRSDKTTHGLRFTIAGFPYLGIWAARNADFVCIEPWCGIADAEDTNQQLSEKEGVKELEEGAEFSRSWAVALF